MKKNSENSMNPLNLKEVKVLTQVVKETLASAFAKPKIFSAADLWDIQRRGRGKTMMQRRSYFA
jgi:hypothetical protein